MAWIIAYMRVVFCLLLLIPLVVMAVSDMRRREVGLLWMVAFILGSLAFSAWTNGWRTMAVNVLWNALLVCYLSLGIIVYLLLRCGRWINPFKGHAGEGDLLLALGMAPLFAPAEYLHVILAGLAVSLLWWVAMAVGRRKKASVPLVATMGVTTGVYLIYCSI